MNLRRITRSFSTEDWALLGYLAGIAVWWIAERLAESRVSQPARGDNTQRVGGFDRVHLGEQALERIEQGETVTVDRWHGGTVRLQGDLVVEVEEIVGEDDSEDDDG